MIILDLDNCIANDGWRIPHINWQTKDVDRRYHNYHMLAAYDAVGNRDLFEGRSDILIFTARPVTFKAMTVEWLRRSGVPFKNILMRNVGDHRPSVKLKEAQLHWLTEYAVGMADIEWAADDRPEVIEMYKSYGLRTKLRSIHNVCAYTMPQPIKDEQPMEDHYHGKD